MIFGKIVLTKGGAILLWVNTMILNLKTKYKMNILMVKVEVFTWVKSIIFHLILLIHG